MKNRNKRLIREHKTYMKHGHVWEPDEISQDNPSGRAHNNNRVKKVVAFVDEDN